MHESTPCSDASRRVPDTSADMQKHMYTGRWVAEKNMYVCVCASLQAGVVLCLLALPAHSSQLLLMRQESTHGNLDNKVQYARNLVSL